MISLQSFLFTIFLFAFVSHVSAFWGSTGLFGQTSPRFSSPYFSPNSGIGSFAFNNPWSMNMGMGMGMGMGGGFLGGGRTEDMMDDMFDRNTWSYSGSFWGGGGRGGGIIDDGTDMPDNNYYFGGASRWMF